MADIFARHADICKTLSHPKRLEIINALRDGQERSAGRLLERIEISKANLSQHMAVLVQKGVVASRREGINVHYTLSDSRITEACDLMRAVLLDRLAAEAKAIKRLSKQGGARDLP